MITLKTLVLGNDMMPVTLPYIAIDATEAVKRVLNGTCFVVSSYDHLPIQTRNPGQLEKYGLTCWPSIIARTENLTRRYGVALSQDNLFLRDGGRCQYCGVKLTKTAEKLNTFTRDHVMPKSRGGKDEWSNIVAACAECNSEKSDQLPGSKWVPKIKPAPLKWGTMMALKKKQDIIVPDPMWMDFIGEWDGKVVVKVPGINYPELETENEFEGISMELSSTGA